MKIESSKLALRMLVLSALFLATLIYQPATGFAQGTAFTYQGQLNSGGSPANGSYDLQFGLWSAASGPSQIGSTLTNTATAVSNGLFTVTLDFGATSPARTAGWRSACAPAVRAPLAPFRHGKN